MKMMIGTILVSTGVDFAYGPTWPIRPGQARLNGNGYYGTRRRQKQLM